jgi:carbonic anhydrase
MIPAQEALTRLKEGNRRFVAGRTSGDDGRPRDLSGGQAPMAAILGCSDSRVPAEIVFDQGPGDLFIVRVAGNIASPTQIGSIEFAASVLGTRLVVVLGHQECGAVEAALEQLRAPWKKSSNTSVRHYGDFRIPRERVIRKLCCSVRSTRTS